MTDRHKYVAFGGARGGGKSWAVRTKAKLLAMRFAGIRILIVRRTYPELRANHITLMRAELAGAARYTDRDKTLTFKNGSVIQFAYCAKNSDLDRLQGTEYDVIFLDEATQLTEHMIKTISACIRGVNGFPKRMYLTCNPGGVGHGYVKRLFIDRRFADNEDGSEYSFIQSLVTDNTALMRAQPEYVKQLQALPPRLRKAWLEGRWDVCEGQFFEDFVTAPPQERCAAAGLTAEQAKKRGFFTHVITPFDVSKIDCTLYRSYDFGYNRPFSCGWWACDRDGVLYRILELYGSTGTPNEGSRMTPDAQAEAIAQIERTHPYLANRAVIGVADPSIWDASRGISVADAFAKRGVYFTPGDNHRVAGWMQCHLRLRFDENGRAGMYVFDTCRDFIRTVPLLTVSQSLPEDLDTDGEDHAADEWRYMCMARPLPPAEIADAEPSFTIDPLR